MKAAGAVIAVTCLAAVGASSFFHQRVAKRSTDCHQVVGLVTATDSKPPTDGDGPTQGDRAKKEKILKMSKIEAATSSDVTLMSQQCTFSWISEIDRQLKLAIYISILCIHQIIEIGKIKQQIIISTQGGHTLFTYAIL